MMARADVALIVPVYHCVASERLDRALDELAAFLHQAPDRCELILVDDRGTQPGASATLRRFASGAGIRLLQNDRNRGKGYSIARGMLATTAQYRVFTDADLAYPAAEIWKIVERLERGADVAIACRVLPESVYVMRAQYLRYLYTRHMMSRAFNRLVRLALLPGIRDTQAGLKGFTADAATRIFPRVRIAGFGFDLECLRLARRLGLRVEQVPVHFRYGDEPSTVRVVRDALTMTADLARIRWREWRGSYDHTGIVGPLADAPRTEAMPARAAESSSDEGALVA